VSTPADETVSGLLASHSATVALLDRFYAVLDGVKSLEKKLHDSAPTRSPQPAATRTVAGSAAGAHDTSQQEQHPPTAQAVTTPPRLAMVVFQCSDDVSVSAPAAEVVDFATVQPQHSLAYRVPAVRSAVLTAVLHCVRERVTRGIFSSSACADALLAECAEATHILRCDWLFALLAARLYAARGRALPFLHQLIAGSFLARHSVPAAIECEAALVAAAAARGGGSAAEDEDATLSGGAASEDVAAVFNMFWYLKCVDAFPSRYQSYARARAKSAQRPATAAAAAAPPPDAPPKWITVYAELYFSETIRAHTLSSAAHSAAALITLETLPLLRYLGPFVERLQLRAPPVAAEALVREAAEFCPNLVEISTITQA
jgi:hypothetical protein